LAKTTTSPGSVFKNFGEFSQIGEFFFPENEEFFGVIYMDFFAIFRNKNN
jgi:hypothetical protein